MIFFFSLYLVNSVVTGGNSNIGNTVSYLITGVARSCCLDPQNSIVLLSIFWVGFFSTMQTNKVREEFSEDMSISRAFSIVFDRRPDLRFTSNTRNTLFMFCNLNLLMVYLNWSVSAGWRGLSIRYYSGICVEWKVGLLQMLKQSPWNPGTRQVLGQSTWSFTICYWFRSI